MVHTRMQPSIHRRAINLLTLPATWAGFNRPASGRPRITSRRAVIWRRNTPTLSSPPVGELFLADCYKLMSGLASPPRHFDLHACINLL